MTFSKWLGQCLIICILVVATTEVLAVTNETSVEGPYMEQTLPSFSGSTLTGDPIAYEKGTHHKTVIHFFATWCYPCQEEMPAIAALSNVLQQQDGSQFIPVNLTSSERSKNDIAPFLQQYEAQFDPILDLDGTLQKQFQIFGVPTTIVVDQDGIVTQRINGPITKDDFHLISEP